MSKHEIANLAHYYRKQSGLSQLALTQLAGVAKTRILEQWRAGKYKFRYFYNYQSAQAKGYLIKPRSQRAICLEYQHANTTLMKKLCLSELVEHKNQLGDKRYIPKFLVARQSHHRQRRAYQTQSRQVRYQNPWIAYLG